jgi:hypothetical protein
MGNGQWAIAQYGQTASDRFYPYSTDTEYGVRSLSYASFERENLNPHFLTARLTELTLTLTLF